MPLDASKIINASYLKCSYIVDFLTGVGNLRVTALDGLYNPLGDGEVATAVAQIGVPIQLAQTSFNLANMNMSSVAMGAVGSVLENGRSWLGSLRDAWNSLWNTGDCEAWGQDLRELGSDVATNVGSATIAGSTEVRTSGSNGGLAVLRLGVRVNAKFMYIAAENLQYVGRPLCAFRTLRNLFGFCQVSNGDIELGATTQEAQAVKSFLEHGVYLEGYSSNSGVIVNTGDSSEGTEILVDDGTGGSGGSGGSGGTGDGEIIVEG